MSALHSFPLSPASLILLETGLPQDSDICYPSISLSSGSFMTVWLSPPPHPKLVLDFYYIAV